MVALTPALIAVALRDDLDRASSDLIRLTVAMLLVQCTVLVVALLRLRQARDEAEPRPAPRAAVVLAAAAVGAALLVTAPIPRGAWFAGLAMFGCFSIDAAVGRVRGLRWIPLAVGMALLVCWVFAGVDRWDVLLWWMLALALCAGLALNAASTSGDGGRLPRRSLSGSLAAVGLLCSIGAIVVAWRSPGAAILIAIEGAFALLLIQRAARRFGMQGVFGVASAASILAAAVFVCAL